MWRRGKLDAGEGTGRKGERLTASIRSNEKRASSEEVEETEKGSNVKEANI